MAAGGTHVAHPLNRSATTQWCTERKKNTAHAKEKIKEKMDERTWVNSQFRVGFLLPGYSNLQTSLKYPRFLRV